MYKHKTLTKEVKEVFENFNTKYSLLKSKIHKMRIILNFIKIKSYSK